MVSYNISIKEDAYKFLKSLKRKDESFSDIILEFKEKKDKFDGKELLKFAGVLKNVDWKSREGRMGKFRDSFNKRIENTADYMEKNRKNK